MSRGESGWNVDKNKKKGWSGRSDGSSERDEKRS